MPEFKAGDMVRLKSGSPDLTVSHVNSAGTIVVMFWGRRDSGDVGLFGRGSGPTLLRKALPPESLVISPNNTVNHSLTTETVVAKISCKNPEAVAKRAFFLAYTASQVFGMGFLRTKDDVTEDQVWENVRSSGDYPSDMGRNKPGRAYGDYVFGRMMKLSIEWDADGVTVPNSQPRGDYQSWYHKYPTYAVLVEMAFQETQV